MPCSGVVYVRYVFLSKPLYISIGGLKPVPINHLAVPVELPENISNFMFLVGLDVINQHTSIISRFNGDVHLKIVKQRDEL